MSEEERVTITDPDTHERAVKIQIDCAIRQAEDAKRPIKCTIDGVDVWVKHTNASIQKVLNDVETAKRLRSNIARS